DRPGRQPLGELPPADGDRRAPSDRPDHRGLGIVAVAVRSHHPGDREAVHLVREEGDHVPAVHLAVDEDVYADLLLTADPLLGRLALQRLELLLPQLFARKLAARFQQVRGLGEASNRRRQQWLRGHAASSRACRTPAARTSSFCLATRRGRNSNPALGPTCRWDGETISAARRQALATASRVSILVFRASRIPNPSCLVNRARRSTSQFLAPAPKSSPMMSTGVSRMAGWRA